MLRRWRSSLFSRVFVHGVLVLIAGCGALVALASALVRPTLDRHLLDVGNWIAQSACRHLTTNDHDARPTHLIATAYSPEGVLLGSLASPPVPPLSAEQVARLRARKAMIISDALHVFWCADVPAGAYVELVPPTPELHLTHLLPPALALLVVALASIPFARSIARPLTELVRATQAFGRGNLGFRTAIARGDEVGELARAWNQMADRLQQLILAEKELLANVSHELRTPLARIRVVLELAQENPRRAQALLEELSTDLGDLERLVDTVMETMRRETRGAAQAPGLLPARLEHTDLAVVVQDALKRFKTLHPARPIDFVQRGAAFEADADPRLLRHLLDNLLDNAQKYSKRDAAIALAIAREDGSVQLEVRDRGIGIAQADLPHVFEPFFRGSNGRALGARGAGLGLSLAKRIADAHGARIDIASEPGVGTTVRIALACEVQSRG